MNSYDIDEQRGREIKQMDSYQVAGYSRKHQNRQNMDEEYSNNSRLSYYELE